MQSRPLEPSSSVQRHKIAIPKLDRGPFLPPKSSKRNSKDRISRACKACRKRKIKCSGDVPKCQSCHAAESICVYEQSRRDRLREATKLNHILASLLKKLSDRVNNEENQEIIDALEYAEYDMISQTTEASLKPLGNWKQPAVGDEQETREDGESHVGGATGSNEGIDYLDEDLTKTRESRATGYIGHNSEVRWLRSVQRQTEHTGAEPHAPPYGPPGAGQTATNARSDALHTRRDNARQSSRQGSIKRITESSFYLDASTIDVDIIVDPYDVPDPEAAERLFECYMGTVHSSFPLVSATFQDQFHRYMESIRNGRAFLVPDKWRAYMNLLFAIGAKYSHLIGAEWRGDERDHLVYMTRAVHLLGLKDIVMAISEPDLELVQATGTLSFYFLIIGHVSRAWIMIGISLRLALALGLHLRNEDSAVDTAKKDALMHSWWSLHSIECLLSSVTGRPPAIATEYCTVPLPRSSPGYQESSGVSRRASYRGTDSGLPPVSRSGNNPEFGKRAPNLECYRISRIKISLIAQKALLHLYSPITATQSWKSIQKKISDSLNDLDEWGVAALSKDLKAGPLNHETGFEREQFLLKIEYFSTKILITRPCLCRLERRIRHQSYTSANFDANAAEACVNAASEIAELFPEQPSLDYIYNNGPWWVITHIIMQSTAVLLLEMSYKAQDMKKDASSVTRSIRKLIRWLQAMQDNDLVAARAYEVVWRILKACAPVLQVEVSKILALDGEDSQANSLQRLQNEQGTAYWQQPDFFQTPMVSSGTFDPSAFHQQPFDSLFENQPVTHTFPFANQDSATMPFGNPFFTSFDQIVPVVNIQDLWSAPPDSDHLEPGVSILGHSQGQQELPHYPEIDPTF